MNYDGKGLKPHYVSGLAQGDGSFFVTISKNPRKKGQVNIIPTFSITQNLESLDLLYKVKDYFQCGRITKNLKRNSAEYRVFTIKD